MPDFDEVVRREADGSLLVGIHRSTARKFWTDVPIKDIEAHTGERPYAQKAIVYFAFVGGPVVLLASLIRAPWVLGWWAVLCIPLSLLIWVGFYAKSGIASGRLRAITVVLLAVATATASVPGTAKAAWQLALLYTTSLWLSRLLYVASTSFFRYLVLNNRRAWEWLSSSIDLADSS
jgi:hypothetical protein